MRDWTAGLLAQPLGRSLVIAVGVAIGAFGVVVAINWSHRELRAAARTNTETRRWLLPIGRFGHLARAVVFVIIGGFLLAAAVHYDPHEALGLGGSLRILRRQPYGRYCSPSRRRVSWRSAHISLSRPLSGGSRRPLCASSPRKCA